MDKDSLWEAISEAFEKITPLQPIQHGLLQLNPLA
ncbi:hypothetical protein AKUG0417_15070 [Apilactobacillus kunkeei]|nr:hypothetical protein AKUG0417_15070 [Apilactobacillus kunkeei]